MKVELTNKVVEVFFFQYGDFKKLIYNGHRSDAVNHVKHGYGVKTIEHTYEYTQKVFLPKGYSSIETLN